LIQNKDAPFGALKIYKLCLKAELFLCFFYKECRQKEEYSCKEKYQASNGPGSKSKLEGLVLAPIKKLGRLLYS